MTVLQAQLDVCPLFKPIRKQVIMKIATAIPFKLVSMVEIPDTKPLQKMISLEYDLWDEIVTITDLKSKKSIKTNLTDSVDKICQILSFDKKPLSKKMVYRLLLNPQLDNQLRQMQSISENEFKLIHIDWNKVLQNNKSKMLLIERTINFD